MKVRACDLATAWPLAARAQPGKRVWRIGYLSATDVPGEPQALSRRLIMEAALAKLGSEGPVSKGGPLQKNAILTAFERDRKILSFRSFQAVWSPIRT